MNHALTSAHLQSAGTIRRLDYGRDLEALGELLDLAFHEEIMSSCSQMRQEFRAMARLMLVFRWIFAIPQLRDAFGGLVWIEDGRLVGNVTLSSVNFDTRRWMISNVATHPSYRRRGIAFHLMQAAISEATRRGAELIMLDVRADNVAANRLYEQLGFQPFDARSEMRLSPLLAGRIVTIPDIRTAGQNLLMRPYRQSDVRAALALAREAIPAHVQAVNPVRASDFQALPGGGLVHRLGRLIGQIHERYAVEQDGRLVAVLTLQCGFSTRPHTIRMLIDSALEGQIEDWLLSKALHELEISPGRYTVAMVRAVNRAQIEALQRRGFTEVLTLQRMALRIP